MKKRLLILLSILVLCTGCAEDSMFFKGTQATREEILEFQRKIGTSIIAEGFYKYTFEDKYREGQFYFQMDRKEPGSIGSHYISSLEGHIRHNSGSVTSYYFKDKVMLRVGEQDGIETRQMFYNANVEFGNIHYIFHNLIFTMKHYEVCNFYIKGSSICITSPMDNDEYVKWAYKYNDDFTKTLKAVFYAKGPLVNQNCEIIPVEPYEITFEIGEYDECYNCSIDDFCNIY